MEIRIVLTAEGQIQFLWPQDRPLLTISLLEQVIAAVKAQALQAERSAGVVLAPPGAMNRINGKG